MKEQNEFDAIIVGGSYAGLSAAMALGRSLKKVLIIDAGDPCNKQTPYSHNFLTQDGIAPAEISSLAKEQVLRYSTVSLVNDLAIHGDKTDAGFVITTHSGTKHSCDKLIFATGIKDLMPEIQGFAECWGISVIHCPYCHGYEFKGKKTGILSNGDKAFHYAQLVNNLTDHLTIITSGQADFTEEQFIKLKAHDIEIIESEIVEIIHENGMIQYVALTDGTKIELDALYSALPFEQHSKIPMQLGCELTELGHLKVDEMQKTNVPGILACGDSTTPLRSVANAVYSGNVAGAVLNMELTSESF